MYVPESTIIITKDGLHCQVYMSGHPDDFVIVKPKYIPTDKVVSHKLPFRYIDGKRMNRLNMWIKPLSLRSYIIRFKKAYPDYIHGDLNNKNWFFKVPLERIDKVHGPQQSLRELMAIPKKSLDDYLRTVVDLVTLFKKSGVKESDLGVTYSTLLGRHLVGVSDINVVVYGKKNFDKLTKFLASKKHPDLRWKTDDEWLSRHKNRGRNFQQLTEKEFLFHAKRKKVEGFFRGSLFLIFGVEKKNEAKIRWKDEKSESVGLCTIRGRVASDNGAAFRPGLYEIAQCEIVNQEHRHIEPPREVIFFTRNFVLQAKKGEKIEAHGLLEKVFPRIGKPFTRLTIGYFGSFLSDQRDKEYIKVVP